MLEQLLKWDRETLIYLNGLGNSKYDTFWSITTEIATWIPLFLLFIVLFFRNFSKRYAYYQIGSMLVLTLFITLITFATKIGIKRIRPCYDESINAMLRILKTPSDYSFFSGHASSSFALATLAFLLLRSKVRWAWFFLAWPLLFSYSRIYVGVHYPTDILVGALIGVTLAVVVYRIFRAKVPYIA